MGGADRSGTGYLRAEHEPYDGLKTYRYLRLGMIAAVLLLGSAVLIEHTKAHCWQTSISAYYYTPAGEVFVGTMVAVGFALIVIKGRGAFEDACLNFSGMLAPLVAFAPTTDVRDPAANGGLASGCWSTPPRSFPTRGATEELAPWLTAKIDNNVEALLWAGAVGLVVAAAVVLLSRHPQTEAARIKRTGIISLGLAAIVIAIVWRLKESWVGFDQRAHGYAAILMFVGLNLVAWRRSLHHRGRGAWFASLFGGSGYFKAYTATALAMSVGGASIAGLRLFDEYVVLALEAWEIAWFATFWAIQTRENWDEDPVLDAARLSVDHSLSAPPET